MVDQKLRANLLKAIDNAYAQMQKLYPAGAGNKIVIGINTYRRLMRSEFWTLSYDIDHERLMYCDMEIEVRDCSDTCIWGHNSIDPNNPTHMFKPIYPVDDEDWYSEEPPSLNEIVAYNILLSIKNSLIRVIYGLTKNERDGILGAMVGMQHPLNGESSAYSVVNELHSLRCMLFERGSHGRVAFVENFDFSGQNALTLANMQRGKDMTILTCGDDFSDCCLPYNGCLLEEFVPSWAEDLHKEENLHPFMRQQINRSFRDTVYISSRQSGKTEAVQKGLEMAIDAKGGYTLPDAIHAGDGTIRMEPGIYSECQGFTRYVPDVIDKIHEELNVSRNDSRRIRTGLAGYKALCKTIGQKLSFDPTDSTLISRGRVVEVDKGWKSISAMVGQNRIKSFSYESMGIDPEPDDVVGNTHEYFPAVLTNMMLSRKSYGWNVINCRDKDDYTKLKHCVDEKLHYLNDATISHREIGYDQRRDLISFDLDEDNHVHFVFCGHDNVSLNEIHRWTEEELDDPGDDSCVIFVFNEIDACDECFNEPIYDLDQFYFGTASAKKDHVGALLSDLKLEIKKWKESPEYATGVDFSTGLSIGKKLYLDDSGDYQEVPGSETVQMLRPVSKTIEFTVRSSIFDDDDEGDCEA